MNPRILHFDTERAPPLWWAWEQKREQYLRYGQMVQRGFFTSIQWAWDWEEQPSAYSVVDDLPYFLDNPTCDLNVVKKAIELVNQADILIAHNGKKFDWKHLRGRAIFHGLNPPKKPYIIDTLVEARKSEFPSNTLGDLADYLKLAEKGVNEADMGKMVTGPISQRIEHIKRQTEYGLKDIAPLKALYYRLRPFMDVHPNMSTYAQTPCCTHCQSEDFIHRGQSPLVGGVIRKQYECKNCGARFKGAIEKRQFFK